MSNTAADKQWWDCPECGAETNVRGGADVDATRWCTECDWSVTVPEPEEVAE